jgi:protein-disulfide isomerase
MVMEENKDKNFMVPGAIIVAGIIIAGAVVYSNGFGGSQGSGKAVVGDGTDNAKNTVTVVENIKPVTAADHIRGDINAPVKVVEFSDLECPFCKRFHTTMRQVVDSYDGKVAWVYRHFPLDNLHSKARREAEATECAADLGGNTAFWAYADRLFEITPANNGLNPEELPKIAEFVGLDVVAFNNCLNSGKYAEDVAADLEDATNSGGQGTPYSIVIAANGKKTVIPGALPFEAVKEIVDKALSEN